MAGMGKTASAYSRAIREFAGDAVAAGKTAEELRRFDALLEGSSELRQALSTVIFARDQRAAVITDLCARLGFSDLTKRTLQVLSERGRMRSVAGVARQLHRDLLEAAGIVPLNIESAAVLSDGEKQKVAARFEKVLGRKVEATFAVVPSLLGGLRVLAGAKTYDANLGDWLGTLEETLVGGRV